MRKLFEAADLVHHDVPDGVNHPIRTLYRVAALYNQGLPADQREGFLDMTLREILATPPHEHFRKATPFVTLLDEATRWKLAFATSATFRKR